MADRVELCEVLNGLSLIDWNASSLCADWRAREVVAQMIMPFRYLRSKFIREPSRVWGNFNCVAHRCARRDAGVPTNELLSVIKINVTNPWRPPDG